jgi:hypothetical protein
MPGEKVERFALFLRLESVILKPVVDDGVTELEFTGLRAERHAQERLELLTRRVQQAADAIPFQRQDEAGPNSPGGSDFFCISD